MASHLFPCEQPIAKGFYDLMTCLLSIHPDLFAGRLDDGYAANATQQFLGHFPTPFHLAKNPTTLSFYCSKRTLIAQPEFAGV